MLAKGKKFSEVMHEQIRTAELYAGVVAKMETWKGYYCLFTDQERAIAQAYGYNIECTNCVANGKCKTF
jgi:hypothetical protein